MEDVNMRWMETFCPLTDFVYAASQQRYFSFPTLRQSLTQAMMQQFGHDNQNMADAGLPLVELDLLKKVIGNFPKSYPQAAGIYASKLLTVDVDFRYAKNRKLVFHVAKLLLKHEKFQGLNHLDSFGFSTLMYGFFFWRGGSQTPGPKPGQHPAKTQGTP